MAESTHLSLRTVHDFIGTLVRTCNHLTVAVVIMGSLFCLMTWGMMQLFQQPERLLNMQTFVFNYVEFNKTTTLAIVAAPGSASKALKQEDPNWDGLLAGASLGMTVGRNVPFIGYAGGLAMGAAIGYKLDSRI